MPDKDTKDAGKVEEKKPSTNKPSLTEVAKEVAAGKWGVGQARRLNLSRAGYNPREVQAEVVRLTNEH